MKQVVFAIALLAMASLTGCLNTDNTSVDENTDSTSDNTGNTNQDGTIDPVGTDGVTIPEESSIHIDSPYHYRQDHWEDPPGSPELGVWECTGENEDRECEFVYHENDYFDADDAIYYDSDGIRNAFEFNGWVNKTGQTVTIEAMHFPYRESYIRSSMDYVDESLLGRPVTDYCTSNNGCEITFYGHGGLMTNGILTSLSMEESMGYWFDSNGDGTNDTYREVHAYEPTTVTFDLPFEPYGFSLKHIIVDYHNNHVEYEIIDRVF